jgi:hypothetical protein
MQRHLVHIPKFLLGFSKPLSSGYALGVNLQVQGALGIAPYITFLKGGITLTLEDVYADIDQQIRDGNPLADYLIENRDQVALSLFYEAEERLEDIRRIRGRSLNLEGQSASIA